MILLHSIAASKLKSGISEDRLSKIQEQIYQIKNNSAVLKKETLSIKKKYKNKKVPVNQKIIFEFI